MPGEPAAGCGVAQVGLGLEALGFGLADPGTDFFRVASGVDRGAVAGNLLVRVGDAGAGRLGGNVIDCAVLGSGDQVNGGRQLVVGEQAGQPVVDVGGEGVFTEVDVARVVDLVRKRVFAGEPAPVVGGPG